MSAPLNNLTFVHDQNLIRICNCGQSMPSCGQFLLLSLSDPVLRYGYCGSTFSDRLQGALDLLFCLGVKRCRRFVK